jgi:hypothetical protein
MRSNLAMILLAAVVVGCSGGGGADSGSSSNGDASASSFGIIHLLEHSPADGELNIATNAPIVLEFDAGVVLDSLGDEDTWLRRSGTSTNLPGSFALSAAGRRVTFTPSSPLAIETDYDFQLSGLTCDNSGRLLDATETFSFRTIDVTPPTLQSVNVANNATEVARTRLFSFTFSEAIAQSSLSASTVYLRDVYGGVYAGARTAVDHSVLFEPFSDLPGDRLFTLTLTTGVTDRAGNAVQSISSTSFRTTSDAEQPSVITMWPAHLSAGISPAVQPTYTFSESMDPYTVEPSSLVFQDQFGSVIPFAIHASDDQRTLRVEPTVTLQENREYTLAFLLGGAAATDVSGNGLSATQALVFTTGTDADAPNVQSSTPTQGQTRVSGNAILAVTFDEALDPNWIDINTVTMTANGEDVTIVVEQPSPETVRITPVLLLPTSATCVVHLRGGHEGLRDLAGNVLAADYSLSFSTSSDSNLPRAMLMPPDGATSVPRGAHVSVVFDAPMDPTTMTSSTIQVFDDNYIPLQGTLTLGGGNRIAIFTPDNPFLDYTYYRTRVTGGSGGVRAVSGNWFSADQNARFRTGPGYDQTSPIVRTTVNGIDDSRAAGLVLPPSGFTIDVVVSDPGDQSIDMSSIEVLFDGAGAAPGTAALFAAATIGYTTFSVTVPASPALAAGPWTLTVRASDLSGNRGTSAATSFTVAEPTAALLPFERTQVVWVRTDLDRDGTQVADFDEDLLRLGFLTEGDPNGTNTRMRNLVLDGIIAQANHLYGRGDRGEPIDTGSVGLRFTKRSPVAITHMQMALGGFDPEGAHNRVYGSDSTGVLGRALYDYRNGNMGERNTGTSPGLGVFPSEMWLYQTRTHIQVWPSYQTVFAQRFRPLCPDMGGVSVGSTALDVTVLDAGFDYGTATNNERVRWLQIMQAADDWSAVIGIILAHEVGHSVGLVAPGAAPSGLFGDSSLHDSYAGATEVMAPSVGYEAMISLDYAFRDIDLAYLRQRILLR